MHPKIATERVWRKGKVQAGGFVCPSSLRQGWEGWEQIPPATSNRYGYIKSISYKYVYL